jgi:hypothetical protein
LVLVKKKSNDLRDPITSEKYPKWRNLSPITISISRRFESETSQAVEPIKRKRISNMEELREQLEKL